MNIFIAMSTYNGSAYLAEQIHSIQEQTHRSWKLLIRDDGSTDNTAEIIQEFAETDKRIIPVCQPSGNIGPCRSFDILANIAADRHADYLMFADQDDYWQPDKVENALNRLLEAEKSCPADTPILVHTDLHVVDSELNSISRSYLRHQHMYDAGNRASKVLLSQNYITGCTIMVNRHLLSIAQPIPESAVMHDWWYSLCASITGVIAFCDKPSIEYRQHKNNVYGSAGFVRMLISRNFFHTYLARKKRNYLKSYLQDTALRDRLASTKYSISREYRILDSYCSAGMETGFYRFFNALKLGIHQQGIIRNIFYYYCLLFVKPVDAKPGNGRSSA